MSRSISRRERRTYFNNPLVMESLRHLPAALEYPTTESFRRYLVENLHHNSESTRTKASEYIAGRFAENGAMNLTLAAALRKFGDSPQGKEIFYFEYQRAMPMLQEIAVRWLAELPQQGGDRAGLLSFLATRLSGKSGDKVAQSAVQAFKLLSKARSPKIGFYVPIWTPPTIEAFLYILAVMYPEPSMIRLDTFTGELCIRAMLWPSASIPDLLKQAETHGHVSKVTKLDQYHQFTLAGTGPERLQRLLGSVPSAESKGDSRARKMPGSSRKLTMGDGSRRDAAGSGEIEQLRFL